MSRQRCTQRLLAQGDIAELLPGLFVQVSDVLYDPVLGLQADPAGPLPPGPPIVHAQPQAYDDHSNWS